MPVFAEQNRNAKLVVRAKIGITLNKYTIDSEKIEFALNELLTNQKYSNRVARLNNIFMDRPISEMDEAEFFVSRLLRKRSLNNKMPHKTKLFFKRAGSNLNFWQFMYAEIAVIFILTIYILNMNE